MKILNLLVLIVLSIFYYDANAQDKFYVPDLLYQNDKFYESGYSMECFDLKDDPSNLTMNDLKYCLQYKTNEKGEKILLKRIEKVGEKWVVIDLKDNKKISYKPNKEIIVEMDEINGFNESGDLINYSIYYYKTEVE